MEQKKPTDSGQGQKGIGEASGADGCVNGKGRRGKNSKKGFCESGMEREREKEGKKERIGYIALTLIATTGDRILAIRGLATTRVGRWPAVAFISVRRRRPIGREVRRNSLRRRRRCRGNVGQTEIKDGAITAQETSATIPAGELFEN